MADNIPLTVQRKSIAVCEYDPETCVICMNTGSKRRPLHGAENGRNALMDAARQLQDERILSLNDHDKKHFKFHDKPPDNCYQNYIKRGKRKMKADDDKEITNNSSNNIADSSIDSLDESLEENDVSTLQRASKRAKTQEEEKNVCVICGKDRVYIRDRRYDHHLFTITEEPRAQQLINVARHFIGRESYHGQVHERIALLTVPDRMTDVVRYHKTCLRRYFIDYNGEVMSVMKNLEQEECAIVKGTDKRKEMFEKALLELDLKHNGYPVSHLRNLVNKKLDAFDHMNNRCIKALLIEKYKENIVFTYPEAKRLSQMFFLADFSQAELAEVLWKKISNPVKDVAEAIANKLKATDFGLNDSYCTSDDLRCVYKFMYEYEILYDWISINKCSSEIILMLNFYSFFFSY